MNIESLMPKTGVTHGPRPKVVSLSIPADLETPVSAYLKLRGFGAKFLLESVEGGTVVGKYSFIGMQPDFRIVIDQSSFHILTNGEDNSLPLEESQSPLSILKKYFKTFSPAESISQPRLLGGAVGFISYDYIRFLENIPRASTDDLQIPMAMFHMIDTLLVFDHVTRRINILSLTNDREYKQAAEKLEQIKELLHQPLSLSSNDNRVKPSGDPVSNFTREQFCRAVRDVKKHIVAGDVYQQVISQRLEGTTEADPFFIYRALRMLNPSPYMYFLDFDDIILIGSSPEALVQLENSTVTVRPIAGTRPRGKSEEEDKRLGEELLSDEKELAEHVMLVDLGRNDLGRCCEVGSVKVVDFMSIEKYSHVMHITSNVTGRLKSDFDQFDLLEAVFPAGTVTGAPKIRAMQLIEEIERSRRGPYAGAVGYFSLSGNSDWCINIRTILMQGNKYFLQGGAGIVADSVPENEYVETLNKIAALRKAIQLAERGL